MVQGVFSWVDLVMGPLFLALIYLVAFIIVKFKYEGTPLKKHFYWGLTVKLVGALGIIVVYGFYYKGGDTFNYYKYAVTLLDICIKTPSNFLEILFSNGISYQQMINFGMDNRNSFIVHSDNYTIVRFVILFSLFTFKSYVAVSLLFAFASFLGVWCLYRTVSYIYPQLYHFVAIPVLYTPSVFFWGSGVMKETVVVGFLGLFTYGIYHLVFKFNKIIISLFLIVISLYFLMNVKEYVLISYAPALFFWIFLNPIKRANRYVKIIIIPVMFLLIAGAIVSLAPYIELITKDYALDNILKKVEVTSEYIYSTTTEGGSSYTLGEVEYTPIGMLKVFPKALFVGLFQPLLHEVKNPVMLISALENTALLLLTLYVLIKGGVIKTVRYIFSEPFLLSSLVFTIIFAFAIGVSTYNYGSLVRYKIPCLMFYGIVLIVPISKFISKDK